MGRSIRIGLECICVNLKLETVNLVGKSNLNQDINLESLMGTGFESFEYNPETFPGASIKINSRLPNILLFSSGKFMVQGADSEDQIEGTINKFLEKLKEFDLISNDTETTFEIVNRVCKLELEYQLDLDQISLEGLNGEIEYFPEQSPYIVYRPDKYDCVFTISSTGNCVVNGITEEKEARDSSNYLISQMKEKKFI